MIYSEAIQHISIELGLSPEVVKKAYESHWKFIRETIKTLPLKEDLSEEEFSKLRTNFNIPSLGKLCLTWKRYDGVKKQYKRFKELQNVQDKINKAKF